MAMRFLLLHLPLPKEQGSIYRLLELFSQKYNIANPGLWDSHDQILVVCYSILMLNTDMWNTNNKVKMTREQYIKNTSGQGVSEDILSVPLQPKATSALFSPFSFPSLLVCGLILVLV
jgi:Sec7-like guanine-nucleotide exchange factor